MEVGKEFFSWESFMHALELFHKEHKVMYVIGTCKPVETANKLESLQSKFPLKFKYCFARLLCNHYGKNSSHSPGLKSYQRTYKTGCTSSILVAVNKKRTALIVLEANLQHTHDISETLFSKYAQNLRLQGEERRMASVLLRSGVSLSKVQEFISSTCSKVPTAKDAQSFKTHVKNTLSEKEGHEFAFLSELDQLMAEDPESIVEMINFSLVPGAVYIQTSAMTKTMNSLQGGALQIVTHDINDGKISLVSIIGLDDLSPNILAFGIIIASAETMFRCFLESFVKYNPTFCDSLTGIVLDCSKDNADLLQQLIPQASVAWSRSYILDRFTEEANNYSKDIQKNIQFCKELRNSTSEELYGKKLKELFDSLSHLDCKKFLNTWDSYKELWTWYEISTHPGLQHQNSALEVDFIKFLKIYIKPFMSVSEIVKASLKLSRNEEPEAAVRDNDLMHIDPSWEYYQQLCFPEASQAVISQLAIALSSLYEIKEQGDMIFVKKKDTGDEFLLDTSGSKCTCHYFLDTDLPCQHIFAWLHSTGKPLYSELLIPAKWQVFGKSITLDALAESLSQGYVPSSRLHDERLKELQTVLKDTLSSCSSHSYEQMGKDLILLKQIFNVMKNNLSHSATLLVSEDKKENLPQNFPDRTSCVTPAPKKRGRPSKKPKLQQELSLKPPEKTSTLSLQKTQTVSPVMRHNLRTNIKHKFVTRERRITQEQTFDTSSSAEEQKNESERSKAISVDSAELMRVISPKSLTTATSSSGIPSEDQPLNDDRVSILLDTRKVNTIYKEASENNFAKSTPPNNMADDRSKAPTQDSDDVTLKTEKPLSLAVVSRKKPHSETLNGNTTSQEENTSDEEENEYDDHSSEDDNSEDETGSEMQKAKRAKTLKDIDTFLSELPQNILSDAMKFVSAQEGSEVKSESTNGALHGVSASAVDALIKTCDSKFEYTDAIKEHLHKSCQGYSTNAYQVAACVIYQAFLTGVPINDMLQSVRAWPNHLPDLPVTRCLEVELTLTAGQTLTVSGHKLNQLDMDTLKPDREISPKVLHAFLELLAQKHSGKVFVIPFDVIFEWRDGRFSQNIFRKVHFKTFDYLVLPIHCGAEFTETERKSGDIVAPCWMALVADVKKRTVGVINPRCEDKYIIAANGYMLQWRRYMQIRSVHTGEMLSSWTSTRIECSKIGKDPNSGILLIMNVEALINGAAPVVMSKAHIPNYLLYIAVALRDTDRETTVLCVGGPECQQLAARDADWLQCENCRTWWHQSCSRHADNRQPFYCSPCQQRITLVGGKALMVECDDADDDDEEDMQIEDVQKDSEKQDDGNIDGLKKL